MRPSGASLEIRVNLSAPGGSELNKYIGAPGPTGPLDGGELGVLGGEAGGGVEGAAVLSEPAAGGGVVVSLIVFFGMTQ